MTREHKLADILKETAKAHHKAYSKTDGHDPHWAEWYAKHLLKETDLATYIPGMPETSLAHLLAMLEHQYKSDHTRQGWEHYYARKLLKIG